MLSEVRITLNQPAQQFTDRTGLNVNLCLAVYT
jgi:hypothetical protein